MVPVTLPPVIQAPEPNVAMPVKVSPFAAWVNDTFQVADWPELAERITPRHCPVKLRPMPAFVPLLLQPAVTKMTLRQTSKFLNIP